jgi:hypothetical protein
MITKFEKSAIGGASGFVGACIIIFLLDLSREATAAAYITIILAMAAVLEISLYVKLVSNTKSQKKGTIFLDIRGVSRKDTVFFYLDGKLVERYKGEIPNAELAQRLGKHSVAFRYGGLDSSAEIEITKRTKISAYVSDSGIDIKTRSEIPVEGDIEKEIRSGIRAWLISVIIASPFVFVAVIRVLSICDLI